MKRKIMAFLLAVVMTASCFTGCGQKQSASNQNDEEVTVINYPTFQIGVNTSAPFVAKLVEGFNKEYAGKYKINIEEVPGDANYTDKIKALLSANQLPDVVYGAGYSLLDLILAKDAAVDLTPYMDKDPEWKGLFSKETLDFNSRNGKIYAVPNESSVIGYFYNKELFAKAGIKEPAKTWDEFFAQCDTLLAKGITPLAMDTADSAWVTQLWLGMLYGTSSKDAAAFMNKMHPDNYNMPEFEAAVAKVQTMLQKYTTADANGGKYENAANNFMSGKVAMMANGPWMTGDFSDTTKADKGFEKKVGVAVYPGNAVYQSPMEGMIVTAKDPKHIEAAVAMVKYFTSKSAQNTGLDLVGLVPAMDKVELTDSVKQKYPLLADLLDQSKTVDTKFNYLQSTMYPNLNDLMSQNLPMLITGKMDAKQFCTEMTNGAMKNK